jgi:histidinol phosphatase-like PHP family hydrolase
MQLVSGPAGFERCVFADVQERGANVVISADAHTTTNLAFIRYGITMARRGWIEKKNVINTLPASEFLAALRPKPGAFAKKHAVRASR